MALVAGTVTIADNGTETKTPNSLAEAIYDSFISNYKDDTGFQLPPAGEDAPVKKGFATLATRISEAVIDYLVANTEVTTQVQVGPLTAGLQKIPPAVLANLTPALPAPVFTDANNSLVPVTLDNQTGTGTIA